MTVLSTEALDPASRERSAPVTKPVRVLAYVHLRNIHNSTGAGRVARQLTSHLVDRQDLDVKILADRKDHARIISQVGAPWNQYDYRFFEADTSRQQARWFLIDRPRAQAFWRDADIVFCTAESYVPKGSARLAVTVHDAAYFESDAHQWNRAFLQQRLKWQLLYRALSRKADMFHAVSEFSADRLSHFFPAIKSRIRVVHNAVTPIFFESVSVEGQLYLSQQRLDKQLFVLVPGGLHFRKNADLILSAWPQLKSLQPDLKLVVVNHSNPAYASQLQALDPTVQIAGFVSDEALHALYSAAAVVWFPSRYEGFGLPVLEAMASGTAVVTSNASSLPEIAGNAAVLVDPGAAAKHTEAIDHLLRNEDIRHDLERLGRARASRFTWSRAAAEMKEHFVSLL